MSDEVVKCPYCRENIIAGAKKCKHCGEILDPAMRDLEMLKKQSSSSQTTVVNNNNNNNNNPMAAGVMMVPKSRAAYIVLALLFGWFGVHNFYAGFGGRGATQLLITLFLGWLGIGVVITGLWFLIEIFVVNTDARGVRFN